MSPTYRSELNNGRQKNSEDKLRVVAGLITFVIEDIQECIGSDEKAKGQYDNTADDGGLLEILSLSKRLILDELPKRE